MTEADWDSCTDPKAMLTFLRQQDKLSERKGRLFSCAAVRRVWHSLVEEGSRKAVEAWEREVEGTAGQADLEADLEPAASLGVCRELAKVTMPAGPLEKAAQAALLRDIFPNPFRPPPPIPASVLRWNQGLVRRLAAEVYEHRLLPAGHLDSLRLNVLSDALEEASADAALVAHLREAVPHWRGCFALNLILNRS